MIAVPCIEQLFESLLNAAEMNCDRSIQLDRGSCNCREGGGMLTHKAPTVTAPPNVVTLKSD